VIGHRSDDNTVGLHDEGGLDSTDAAGISRTHRPLVREDHLPELRQPERFSEGMAGGIALGVPHRDRLRPAPGSRHDVLFRASLPRRILEGVHAYVFSWSQSAVRFDQWVPFSIDVKWSYGSDGFTKLVIGGETLVDRTGPSLPRGQSPKLQFGYYAVRQLRNEVWFAGGFARGETFSAERKLAAIAWL
jgi:hypothetical protein